MIYAIWAPSVDVLRGREYWCVKLELAGICSDQIHISADDNVLTIRGNRRDTLLAQGYSYQSLEINYSAFERQVTLPFPIDATSLGWEYRDGMLLVQFRPQSP